MVESSQINSIRFTSEQDSNFIACTSTGFRVHDTLSGRLLKSCTKFESGGLMHCRPLGRSNIFIVVGTGQVADEERNRLIVWDDAQSKRVGSVQFHRQIVDIWTEGTQWIVVQLAGDSHLYVFDMQVGIGENDC